jgi:hypothetical protein
MPNPKFPGPAYDQIRDSDTQVKRVDLDNAEIASRRSATPPKMDVGMSIKHVNNES